MEGLRKISLILLIFAVLSDATTMTKEVRTSGLPEKILGGVIEIVHNHKNKPVTQPPQQTYPNQGFNNNPQYPNPQYQQWNGQSSYQGQQGNVGNGYNYHGQYQNQAQIQNQGQYQNQAQYGNYQNQNGYNQVTYPTSNGNYNAGQTYPVAPVGAGQTYPIAPVGGFSNGQVQNQGQYQIVYQNPPSQPQYGTTGQNQQSNQQFLQNQSSGNYQGQNPNTGSFQGQQQTSSNLHGQTGSHQVQGTDTGGQNQSFQVSGGHQASGTAGGPTCVCQAWTKPVDTLNDPAADKHEKMSDAPAVLV